MSELHFKVVVPARYGSTRLPGKPLLPIGGRPMVQHVHERALESGADEVWIATDDARIAEAAEGFGAKVCMTSVDHRSGTDRIGEVAATLGWDDETIVVNLQGDEPLMPPVLVHQAAAGLNDHPSAVIATLATRIHTTAELFDPHVVKVVSDAAGFAHYFSRAPIPWDRDVFCDTPPHISDFEPFHRHIGLYSYSAAFVKQYIAWGSSHLERIESLEQLRVLYHGENIRVITASEIPGPGVNTEEELMRVEQILSQGSN